MVKSQRFEEAASLRDTEKRLRKSWKNKKQLGRRKQNKALPIEEEDIAEVVLYDDRHPC